MPAGRPTDYDPKYIEEITEYFNREPYKKEGNKLIPCDFPTLAGFAVKIGVHRFTLYNWGEKHSEFSDAIKKAKEFQEHIMVTNSMKGLYNTAFSIFAAKNLISWSDKQDITSGDEKIEGIIIYKPAKEDE